MEGMIEKYRSNAANVVSRNGAIGPIKTNKTNTSNAVQSPTSRNWRVRSSRSNGMSQTTGSFTRRRLVVAA
jgi:hypothetical protein